jgi:DNA-binding CsgD family transcriptional regulator
MQSLRKVRITMSLKKGNSALKGSAVSRFARVGLTPREHEILAGIVAGNTSKEVARLLAISPRTVEFHRANLLKKLCARNTAELVGKLSSPL